MSNFLSYEEDFLASLKKQEEDFKSKTERAGQVLLEIKDIEESITPLMWKVFYIIVSNGLSQEKEIKSFVVRYLIEAEMSCYSKDAIYRAIKNLAVLRVFRVIPISTGIRTFHLLQLSYLGEMLYMRKFEKRPPESEMEKVASNHASYTHGYMIEEAKNILEQRRFCGRVTTDRITNKLVLPDGTVVIPDIIAGSSSNWQMFEVECGTHNNSDFYHKCDKLIKVKRHLHFIGSSRESVEKDLIPKIDSWIRTRKLENLQCFGFDISVYSMYDFKKGKCTYFYDMKSSEPVCNFKKSNRKGGKK